MTSPGNGQGSLFHVTLSAKTRQRIRELYLEASAQGRGKQFVTALRTIHARLRSDPREFGEAVFRLPVLKLMVFTAVVAPVVVDYGVHQERSIVIVQHVKLLD